MRPLFIDAKVQAHIDQACERARLHPTNITDKEQLALAALQDLPVGGTIALKDQPPNWQSGAARERVLIPFGYIAAISYEQQPEPLGLCAHLSVSVIKRGSVPHPEAVKFVAEAFGLLLRDNGPWRLWLEEFVPGHHAVNVVEPVEWKGE